MLGKLSCLLALFRDLSQATVARDVKRRIIRASYAIYRIYLLILQPSHAVTLKEY